MAKKKDNGESQIESTFPPAPTLVDAPEIPSSPAVQRPIHNSNSLL